MWFWDSSAIVPLVVREPTSTECRRLLRADRGMAVWALSRTEVVSALRRRAREDVLAAHGLASALKKLGQLASGWVEVQELIEVRGHAERLLGEYPLRAADALQLAAAFVHADGSPKNRQLVVFDEALADAARDLGFTTIGV